MTTELTDAQREHRRKQARDAIAHAMYDTYGQQDTGRAQRIADLAMDALADTAAEILADGTMLKGLNIENGVVTLETEPAREILLTLVASMRTMLDRTGRTRPTRTRSPSSAAADPPPHEFRQQAEARIADALTECDAIEAEQHGQHDEDADGMREAVRRIRAALAGDRDG